MQGGSDEDYLLLLSLNEYKCVHNQIYYFIYILLDEAEAYHGKPVPDRILSCISSMRYRF